MSREDTLMQLIRLKYRSLHNFSVESDIPNSTLNSMFKKGLGGTSFDTVLKVCSILDCDIYSLTDKNREISAEDRSLFSKYLTLNENSKELVKMVVEHQLCNTEKSEDKPEATLSKEIPFPSEKALGLKTIRVYLNAASAGLGEYLEDSDYEDISVDCEIADAADFGIAIHGDSMTPDICDGDVVWVRQQDSVAANQIGVFVLNGDALCKKLVSIGNRFFLRSLNKKYNDIPITEYDSLKVIGRVIDATPFPEY